MVPAISFKGLSRSDLTCIELKIFLEICGLLSNNKARNKAIVNGRVLAEELNTSRVVVCNALKRLVEKDCLIKYKEKIGSLNIYGVNPNLFWAGDGASHRKALEETKKP
ncbi:MAG: hypothetical protein AN485_24215, partial [Anabaena sp. MDT14b]